MNQRVHCKPTSTTVISSSLRPIKKFKKWHIRGFHNLSWSANLLRMGIWWNEHSPLPFPCRYTPWTQSVRSGVKKKKTIQISSASVCKSVATTVDSTVQQWKAIVQEIWKAGTRMRGKVRTTRVLLGHHSTQRNLRDYGTSSDRHDDRIYPQQINNVKLSIWKAF